MQTPHARLLRLIVLLAIPLTVLACGENPVVEAPPAPSKNATRAPTVLAILEEHTDFEPVAEEFGLVAIDWVEAHEVIALYEGYVDEDELKSHKRVKKVLPNGTVSYVVPQDMTLGFHQQWTGEETVSVQPGISLLDLHRVHPNARGQGIRVAVLDTGVDGKHPHLRDRLEFPAPGSPVEWADIADGVDQDLDGVPDDAYGHGTHVAGIIATIAPEATILPIRVLNEEGIGTDYDVARGIVAAINMGADIINMSLAFETDKNELIDKVLEHAKDEKVLILAAAGNVPGKAMYPASEGEVMGISATDGQDHLAPFSAYDVKFAAPGVGIESSFPGSKIAIGTGTSMACAVATGAFSLVASIEGTHDRLKKARELLEKKAVEVCPDDLVKKGRVDPLEALIEGDKDEEYDWGDDDDDDDDDD